MAALDDGLEWPVELSVLPQALVGVAGLDTVNNAVHRVIWEALANTSRQDKSAVHYKLLGPVHEFPPMKPKRTSYEWYMPKGILKRNWIKKHLKEIPAVVVIFYDLDWDDLEWPEKKIECTSRVQSIRASLDGRNNRLAVVLIQRKPAIPATDDLVAVDRAAALCSAADINHKCLFVMTHDDHLQGYVLRLDNAFLEMAQSYYQQEIRHVKSHREFLNKTTHQYLFVRHQFKMGFLSELKQDNRNAHVDLILPQHFAQNIVKFQRATGATILIVSYNQTTRRELWNGLTHEEFLVALNKLIIQEEASRTMKVMKSSQQESLQSTNLKSHDEPSQTISLLNEAVESTSELYTTMTTVECGLDSDPFLSHTTQPMKTV